MSAKRRALLVGALVVAGAVVLAVVVRFGAPVTLSLALAFPPAETPLALLSRDPVREDIVIGGEPRPLRADLYRAADPRRALLLVHGLSRFGRRHGELVRLARALARHGVLVLVPELEGLVAFKLSGSEVDEIQRALIYLRGRSDTVGIAGFSFGAGPALLAAAETPGVHLIGSFGGYADLTNVITYITTGVHTFHGVRYTKPQEEYNRWKLLALLAGFGESESDRQRLESIADRKLRDPAADVAELAASLGREGRTVMDLILNREERAVAALLAALSPEARRSLVRLSPLASIPRVRARLVIAHGAGDESIPFTESLRLAEAAGARAEVQIFRGFHHTGPESSWPSLRTGIEDGWGLLRVANSLLRE